MLIGAGVGQPVVGRAQLVIQRVRRSRPAPCSARHGSHRHRRPAIWSARKLSPGSVSASAAKAGSASPSRRVAAIASISAGSTARFRRGAKRPTMSSSSCVAYCWPGFPAHERIGVVRGEEVQPLRRHARQLDRRGKARAAAMAPAAGYVVEGEALLWLGPAAACRRDAIFQRSQFPPSSEQSHHERDHQRLLVRLARRRRRALLHRQRVATRGRIVASATVTSGVPPDGTSA